MGTVLDDGTTRMEFLVTGAVHQMRNPGTEPATVVWQVRPALRTAEFFQDLTAARADGDLDELLRVVAEYADVFRLADQPSP